MRWTMRFSSLKGEVLGALRVHQWKHFVVLPAATIDRDLSEPTSRLALRVGLGTLVAALALGYAYGLNAIAERRSDRDRAKNPLVGVAVLPWSTNAAVALAALAALGVSTLVGPMSFAATSASLIAGTVYSIGPRLKALPVVGTLLNGAIFGPLLAVSLPDFDTPASFALRLGSFLTLLLQNQLLHECADAAEDAGAAAMTTARLLGEQTVAKVVAALGVCGALGGFFLTPTRGVAIVNALVLLAVTRATLRLATTAARRRVTHRWLSLVAGAVLFVISFGHGALLGAEAH